MRVLLVEDDSGIASFIIKGLKQAGFVVEHAADGRGGLHWLSTQPFDAAIVDVMLPEIDGLTLIRTARRQNVATPVLILSAKSSVDDRVKGLENGGDDYLVKPFAFSELLARLQALIRRASRTSEPMSITVGPLRMDLIGRKVERDGQAIELQPREFALLEYLMRNAGRVVSKTMIMEHVWDYNFDPETNVVEARICRLRDKLDRGFSAKLIHTIRGLGMSLKKSSSFVHTVTFRLTLLFVVLFALLLVAVLIPIDLTLQSTLQNRLDAKIIRHLGEFSYYGSLFDRKSRKEAVEIIADNLNWAGVVDGPEDVLWLLLSEQGQIVTSSNTQPWQTALETILGSIPTVRARSELPASVSSEMLARDGLFYVETGGVKQIAALETRRLPGKSGRFRAAFMKYGNGMVMVSFHSLADIDREMAKYRKVLAAAFACVLVLGAGLGFLTTRHAMGGVQRVTQTALAIGQGDLGRRVAVGRQGREIAEMATAFNEMLGRIEALIKGLKEVTTNIAHDLRSPITTIRGLAEATVSGQPTSAEEEATCGKIVAECDRLIGMINAMLEIAELDSGLAPISDTAVDIGSVAHVAYELFQPVAEDKGVRLECDADGSSSARVRGNLAGLQRAVANLLDNAIKFSPAGAEVKLSVHAEQQHVTVQVADTGTGIDPKTLPHIFDCFYRGDRSRSTAGNGLGLSLAQSVVRAHGGAVIVESTPGAGSTFTIHLPRC